MSVHRGAPSIGSKMVGCPFSFSSQWPDKACLSWFTSLCEDLTASPGLLHGAGVGAIHHCQEMCCTQQGWLSSLLLLQQELQILKRRRTCTLQIAIHHPGCASQGQATLHTALTRSHCGCGLTFLPGTWNKKPLMGSIQAPDNPHTLKSTEVWGKSSRRQSPSPHPDLCKVKIFTLLSAV